jgi:cyclopropane fatty-acyl-phospholipid synthase-like methyltransferase
MAAAAPTLTVQAGYVENVVVGEEKNQRDYYNKANHYDTLWGEDNIHLGFYPHLLDKQAVALNFQQGGQALTRRMIEVARIDHTSKVLDLGCGKGLACKEIAELTGAECVGMDLSETNIERGNKIKAENANLKLDFLVGSFTALPQELLDRKFTHVFSQVAFCHVHKLLPEIFSELKKVLAQGAKAVINDYIGTENEVMQETREHVHKRLHFEMLRGHKTWRRMAEDAGLEIMYYENLDAHMEQSYRHLANEAAKYDFKSADGTAVEKNYLNTVAVAEKRQIGMNIAILTSPFVTN